MMQTELLQKDLTKVGEAISHELGAQMITDFQTANPTERKSYYVGRQIVEKILAQPGCVGIQFYNAIDETGKKTLVYVGIDATGKHIIKIPVVKNDGSLGSDDGIVADRLGDMDGGWGWLFSWL